MPKRDSSVIVAIIGAVALIIAALIGAILQPSWWKLGKSDGTNLVIAGTVVDQRTNEAIGQAVISVVGRSEKYVTEDDGNFRIDFREHPLEDGRARLHVTKSGYVPYDATVSGPSENVIIPLRKM